MSTRVVCDACGKELPAGEPRREVHAMIGAPSRAGGAQIQVHQDVCSWVCAAALLGPLAQRVAALDADRSFDAGASPAVEDEHERAAREWHERVGTQLLPGQVASLAAKFRATHNAAVEACAQIQEQRDDTLSDAACARLIRALARAPRDGVKFDVDRS